MMVRCGGDSRSKPRDRSRSGSRRNPYTSATVADPGNDGFCVLSDGAGLALTLMKERADLF